MSGAALVAHPDAQQDRALAAEVLSHLDAQIESARSLLEVVLEQGAAIRARDVHAVVRLAGILRGEMGRRQLLEEERSRLLARSGERLGVPAEAVTLALLCTLMDGAGAERASARSAELKGLLHELQREHACNRALMQIELGFLDHLMGMLALDGVSGYDTHGSSDARSHAAPPRRRCTSSTCRPEAMSIPTLQGLQTALSGLIAEQQALDIDRQQHRQREHRRLLARDAPCWRPNPPIAIPAHLAAHRPGRAARHRRERRNDHAHPQHLPRRAVPRRRTPR